jgi:hypothetical protein
MSMLMQMSSGMGVAFGAITLHAAVWFRGGNPDTPDIADFRIVFAAAALLALSAVVGYIKLSPAAGAEATGRA